MSRRPLRIATTVQLENSVRAAGYETYLLPELPDRDFNRTIQQRIQDSEIYKPFLEKHDIDVILDFNTEALTLMLSKLEPNTVALTSAELGIPYVAHYIDPITSTMGKVDWADYWSLLENNTWIKWIFELGHGEELMKLGVPNVMIQPMAASDIEYDTSPAQVNEDGPVIAFMGHPASTWFKEGTPISSDQLFAGLTAAAVNADMPTLPYHQIYYDLYQFDTPPHPSEDKTTRIKKSFDYFNQKFIYNAYLAVKQRDRFARFLKNKLGDSFELVGDHWEDAYDLKHTPRVWDMKVLHNQMRCVPICLNLMKGNLETGLNMRHFEITAHGGFMLTYDTPELHKHFEVGEECESFRHEQELLEKIGFYMNNPKRRQEIALAGQQRTLKNHLYSHRITTMVDLLTQSGVLPRKTAIAEDPKSIPKIQVEPKRTQLQPAIKIQTESDDSPPNSLEAIPNMNAPDDAV